MRDVINFTGERWLQNMKWPKVKSYLARGGDSIIIPCGQTEQHGFHLPMGTDTYEAMALAETVAEYADILIAPPLWLGWGPRMISFTGSMTLRADTLSDIVVDICESLMIHGFERFYIINGHRRENLSPLEIACTEVRYRTGALAAVLDPSYFGVEEQMRLGDGNKNIQSHACGIETAHMLYIHSELVNEEEFVDSSDDLMLNKDHFVLDEDHAIIYDLPEEFRTNRGERGVRGDVTWASKERGRQYHEAVTRGMADFVLQNKNRKLVIRKPDPIA